MSKRKSALSVFFLALICFAFPALAAERKSAYDRVMERGTLRCGYVAYAPAILIDPNTKEMSGIVHDVMEETGKLLNIKIEWAAEVGWGDTVEAIQSGRVDAICVGFWQNPAEGKLLGFTIPLWYSAVNAFVRNDDARFDKDLSALDAPDIKVATSDGEMAGIIARQDFPRAQILSLPNMTDVTQQLLAVNTKKADVTFVENYLAKDFLANNPGSLKSLTTQKPLRVFGNTIAIPQDDVRLQSMLNSAFVQILNSGQMDKILDRYEKHPGSFYRVAPPYKIPK